ncbi:MAG: HvfC/BufC family peptide modification chaperone, partial [Alphaproteobacteria bacterium]
MPVPPELQSLSDVQTAFKNAIFNPPDMDVGLEAAIAVGGLTTAEKISIHRNNTYLTLTESLAAVFPVIRKLVGEEFFDATAYEFIRQRPPRRGSLLFYGDDFGDFLDRFSPAASLPYLGDVARLEWAWHEAFHGADATGLDGADLQKIAPERLDRLRLGLHPSARLLISPWPVAAIWQANQHETGEPESIDLSTGGCDLLVIR